MTLPNFQKWPAVAQNETGSTIFEDVANHCPDYSSFKEAGSKITSCHEGTHGCNAAIRNKAGGRVNGFYVGLDRSIVIPEPNCRKSDAAQYVPESLRGDRFATYVTGQSEWDDSPLYLFDEFVAYTNGAWAAIELKRSENYVEGAQPRKCRVLIVDGKRLPVFGPKVYYESRQEDNILGHIGGKPVVNSRIVGSRIIDGPVEFISYATAVLIAADKSGPLDTTLAVFSNWLFRHAYNSYFEALKDFPPFEYQDKFYRTQLNGSEWSAQREFLSSKIGYRVPTGIEDENQDPIDWIV